MIASQRWFSRSLVLTGMTAALTALAGQSAQAFEPEQADFQFNRALYSHYSKNHLSAAALAIRMQTNGSQREGEEALNLDLMALDNLLNYGLYQEASRRFREMLPSERLSNDHRAEFWLKLARYEFERGYFEAAEQTLTEMRVDVGGRRNRIERASLLGQIQLRLNKAEAAIDTLEEGRVYTKDEFARYNLAMAYLQAGDIRRGRRELEKLGTDVVNDPIEHALRDRANLALAYNYLEEAKGASARPALRRIRVQGPYSDEALLGLGWAEIAADKAEDVRMTDRSVDDTIGGVVGAILRPGRVDDDIRSRLGMLRQRSTPESEDQRIRKALAPWLELDSRDPINPAVLEVQLAIPYALDALGETTRARRFYERAVERLELGRDGLDKAMEGIRSGRMVETMIRRDQNREAGWNWRLRDLPDAPETYYLAKVLGGNEFQEALKNYRDLKQLQRKLARQRLVLQDNANGVNKATVPPSELFRQKLSSKSAPLFQDLSPKLNLETKLGRYPRNETLEGLLAWTYRYAPKIQLKLAGTPNNVAASVPPASLALIERIDALLEQINLTISAQRALLEDIAVSELERYKSVLTRYLIDARFAVARMYDEEQMGESLE